MKKFVLLITAVLFTGALSAAEDTKSPEKHPIHKGSATFYITSQDVELTPIKGCAPPSWVKLERKKYELWATRHDLNETNGWQTLSCSFVPQKDGMIRLTLLGGGTCKSDYFAQTLRRIQVVCDQITLDGAGPLNNPDFEFRDAKGAPNGWFHNKLTCVEGNGTVKPLSGKYMLLIESGKQASQNMIKVTGGEPVTITAQWRFYQCQPPQK